MRRVALFFLMAAALLVPAANASNLVVWNLVGVQVHSVGDDPGQVVGSFTYDADLGAITGWDIDVDGITTSTSGDARFLNVEYEHGAPGMGVEPLVGMDLSNGVKFTYAYTYTDPGTLKDTAMLSWISFAFPTPLALGTPGKQTLQLGGSSVTAFSTIPAENGGFANLTSGMVDSSAPEPGICVLAGTGLVGLALLRRRAARKA